MSHSPFAWPVLLSGKRHDFAKICSTAIADGPGLAAQVVLRRRQQGRRPTGPEPAPRDAGHPRLRRRAQDLLFTRRVSADGSSDHCRARAGPTWFCMAGFLQLLPIPSDFRESCY